MEASSISGGENLKALLDRVKGQKATLLVGYFPDAKYIEKDGVVKQVAQVAAENEYGHVNPDGTLVPARPFMSKTYDDNKAQWSKFLQEELIQQGEEIDVKKALRALGYVVKHDIQETIDWWAEFGQPRNSKVTIREKGFDSPLIHSGKMRASVRSVVK